MYWITGLPCPKCEGEFLHDKENHQKIIQLFGTKRSNDLKEPSMFSYFGLIKVCTGKRLVSRNPNKYKMAYFYGCINGHRFSNSTIQKVRQAAENDYRHRHKKPASPKKSVENSRSVTIKKLAWLYATRKDSQSILDFLREQDTFGDGPCNKNWHAFFTEVGRITRAIKKTKDQPFSN